MCFFEPGEPVPDEVPAEVPDEMFYFIKMINVLFGKSGRNSEFPLKTLEAAPVTAENRRFFPDSGYFLGAWGTIALSLDEAE